MVYRDRGVLTEEERAQVRGLVGSGIGPVFPLTRARILLNANHGEGGPDWSDAAVAGRLGVSASTVHRVRWQSVEDCLHATLARTRPDRVCKRRLAGAHEAHLIALACSVPPEGQRQWSRRRLAAPLVQQDVVETSSHETVRQTLKTTPASRA